MPVPRLDVTWAGYQAESLRLRQLVPSLASLQPGHRKLVAEIVLVRLFLLLENAIASTSAKILCGAGYLDATRPARVVTPRSMVAAVTAMKVHGRTKPKGFLKWTDGKEIRDNMRHTLSSADPFFACVSKHGALLTEMRYVRNHIAHSNSSTRLNFRKVVRTYYGALRQGVTPGVLLLTPALGPPCVLERYIVGSRVVVTELLRA